MVLGIRALLGFLMGFGIGVRVRVEESMCLSGCRGETVLEGEDWRDAVTDGNDLGVLLSLLPVSS